MELTKERVKAIEILRLMAGYSITEVDLTLQIVDSLIKDNSIIIESPQT